MKHLGFAFAAALVGLAAASAPAITVDGIVDAGYGAAVSTDPTTAWVAAGDEGGAGNNGILDLENLHAIADAGNLYIALTIDGDITAADWGKYCVFINSPNLTGTSTTDQWARPVTSTSNYQFHSWVDAGGGSGFHVWDNGTTAWVAAGSGTAFAFDGGQVPSVVEISIPLSQLGNPSSVDIVAWSTAGGGTDNAQDAIPAANGNAADWGTVRNLTSFVNGVHLPDP